MQTIINHKQRSISYIESIDIHSRHVNKKELNILDRMPYEKFMYLVDYSYNSLIKTVSIMEPEIGEFAVQRIESQLDENQEKIFIQLREVYERIIMECYSLNRGNLIYRQND
ncbi:hypothetical protein MKY95_09975 [Paenibacillus sp. FSL P4-0176]|uniref:hypothetical protein n=1 Tax=Paenibacillus sp. FSL P4-0176 TaxID=2921631 RepID=UPI0030D134CF